MIGYPISEAELWARIEATQPTWRNRTEQRTALFVANGRYEEANGIWSEIKAVYMELQSAKCGYCERWLESADFGLIEHDVEHFRPKSCVGSYPPSSSDDVRHELNYSFSLGNASNVGYFQLAYHPLNYLTTCKTCNSRLKSDFFPVAAPRITGATHPREARDEQPFLFYPIGNLDVPPETLIGFEGIVAVPIGGTLAEQRRAEVTIDFFQLNVRENLRRERAHVISTLFQAMDDIHHLPEEKQRETKRRINAQMSPRARHTNCSRCFVRLFQSQPGQAREFAHEAGQLLLPDER